MGCSLILARHGLPFGLDKAGGAVVDLGEAWMLRVLSDVLASHGMLSGDLVSHGVLFGDLASRGCSLKIWRGVGCSLEIW